MSKKRQYTVLIVLSYFRHPDNISEHDQHLRYKSNIFIGKNLYVSDHNDLINIGIKY